MQENQIPVFSKETALADFQCEVDPVLKAIFGEEIPLSMQVEPSLSIPLFCPADKEYNGRASWRRNFTDEDRKEPGLRQFRKKEISLERYFIADEEKDFTTRLERKLKATYIGRGIGDRFMEFSFEIFLTSNNQITGARMDLSGNTMITKGEGKDLILRLYEIDPNAMHQPGRFILEIDNGGQIRPIKIPPEHGLIDLGIDRKQEIKNFLLDMGLKIDDLDNLPQISILETFRMWADKRPMSVPK